MSQATFSGISWQLGKPCLLTPLLMLACQLPGPAREGICQLAPRGREGWASGKATPGHLSSQSQGVTMPYNWACVCVMRPCSWDSSACLHPGQLCLPAPGTALPACTPALSHLSLVLQGIWDCMEEQKAWAGEP